MSESIVIESYGKPSAVILKSTITAVSIASDDEQLIKILTQYGEVKVYVSYDDDINDELARIVGDLGWV